MLSCFFRHTYRNLKNTYGWQIESFVTSQTALLEWTIELTPTDPDCWMFNHKFQGRRISLLLCFFWSYSWLCTLYYQIFLVVFLGSKSGKSSAQVGFTWMQIYWLAFKHWSNGFESNGQVYIMYFPFCVTLK